MKRPNDNVTQYAGTLRDRFDYQQVFSHADHIHHINHQYPFSVYQSPLEVPAIPAIAMPHEYLHSSPGVFSPPQAPQSLFDIGACLGFPTYMAGFNEGDTYQTLSTVAAMNTVTPPPDFTVSHVSQGNPLLFNGGFPYILANDFLPALISSPALSMDRYSMPHALETLQSQSETGTPDVCMPNAGATFMSQSIYECQPTPPSKRRRMEEADMSVVRNRPASLQGHQGTESDKGVRQSSKNRPRNTRSVSQKTIFYKWIIDHIDHPFPTDKDREELSVDHFDKKDFYWWFSNHRHRNLECSVDARGKKIYAPKLTFYKTCQRLGLDMPWPIPDHIRCQLKRPST
ncbi:hypothetical protein FBU31_003728 [Coemansia sp. 'formosensis']|nr:hypothetical protein FBU31_003728 [Coemansia sp. 'formosensis']